MPQQSTTIQVDEQTAEALAEYAAQLGLTVPDYLRKHFIGGNGSTPIVDANGWLDELSAGLDHIEPLPRDFSTADLYSDHD